MNSELSIAERLFRDGILLDLQGDLTMKAEESLLKWRDWENGMEGRSRLVLNFNGVDYVNSAGIAILIRLAHAAQQAGFSLYGFGINAHYQRMFRLIGLTDFLTIYPDEYSLMLKLQG